jgi:hypothetical protein
MMRRSTTLILVAGVVAPALPATAAAQSTPAPAAPKLSITTEQVIVSGGRASVLTGQQWRVRVVLKPFVAGQTAVLRFYRDGRKVQAAQLPLAPSPTGQSAFATFTYTSAKPGRILVKATHFATPVLPTLKAKVVGVSVVTPSARHDARTARAVLAFRKVTGMRRTEIASSDVFRRLARGGGRFRVKFPSHGKHVEADLSRQVIALIRGSKVERIYPVSSGKPSTPTIKGHFRVYLKSPGTNAKGMYMSSYFIRGYAIHGYPSVPVFPASHGCLRVPNSEAVSIFRWLSRGDIVDVYS